MPQIKELDDFTAALDAQASAVSNANSTLQSAADAAKAAIDAKVSLATGTGTKG